MADSVSPRFDVATEPVRFVCTELERFSFDGSCKLSASGDVNLTFDDGTTLRAHKAILSLASPVINNCLAVEESFPTLHLEGVSPRIWRIILHQLYPIHVNLKEYANLSPVLNLA